MPDFIDALRRQVSIPELPGRIISLVPSVTETVIDLGCANCLQGRTHYCIHPNEKVKEIPTIGGTLNIDFRKVKALNPDLILAVKEENDKEQVYRLARDYPVYVFDIHTVDDGLNMVERIAELLGKPQRGLDWKRSISAKLGHIKPVRAKVLYLVWNNPLMAAGRGTFIDSVLQVYGYRNVIADKGYPRPDKPSSLSPDFVMAPSEPYRFSDEELEELKVQFPDSAVVRVDGEIFSWYGTHMRLIPTYYRQLPQK